MSRRFDRHVIGDVLNRKARQEFLGLGLRAARAANDSRSIAMSISKISRSRTGSSVVGSRQPRMHALLRMSGLRPFQ